MVVKKHFIIVFFFLCSSNYAQKKAYLDSILNFENKISQKDFLEKILEIEYDKALTNSKKYLILAKKATKIATEINDEKSLAKSYRAQSLAYHFSSNFDLAIENIIKANKYLNK